MALSDAYCSAATYRTIVAKSDTGSDADILTDLKAISRFLDQKLGRFFTKDAAAVDRVYRIPQPRSAPPLNWCESENPWRYGNVSRLLQVDDIADTTGLTIKVDEDRDGSFSDESAWASTDYELLPVNAALEPEPKPYTAISIPEWSSKYFQAGQRIQVHAIFGWPSVPPAIERATAHLCGILRLESPRATSRVTEMGETLSTSRQAQNIIDELTRNYRRVIGTAL